MSTDAHDEPLESEFLESGFDDPDDIAPPTTLRRKSRGGQMIGAAMIGLAEVLEPKPKVDVPITVEVSGDPPNIDTEGLDELWDEQGSRMVAPPMDDIRAKAKIGKTPKRRR